MTATDALIRHYMQVADRNARSEARLPQAYGGNVELVALRAFVRYNPLRMEPYQLGGRERWLTHKQVAMSGLLARVAVTGEKATITALAKEATVVPSTLSRFLDKLQCWNVYAIDVTRGRHGGIVVRLRGVADNLAAYAERAWTRLRKAAEKALSRTKRNVASPSSLKVEDYPEGDKALLVDVVLMDATFTEAWDAAERRGAVLDRQRDHLPPAASSEQRRSVDPEAFRAAVYAERLRLAIVDPAGESEAVHPLW